MPIYIFQRSVESLSMSFSSHVSLDLPFLFSDGTPLSTFYAIQIDDILRFRILQLTEAHLITISVR